MPKMPPSICGRSILGTFISGAIYRTIVNTSHAAMPAVTVRQNLCSGVTALTSKARQRTQRGMPSDRTDNAGQQAANALLLPDRCMRLSPHPIVPARR